MKPDAFGGCPRLISDRFKATFPAAIAEEAAAIATAIRGRPVRVAAVPEGARLVVPLDPKAGDADALVARLVAAFERRRPLTFFSGASLCYDSLDSLGETTVIAGPGAGAPRRR